MICLRKFLTCLLIALPILAAGFFDSPAYADNENTDIISVYKTSSKNIEGIDAYYSLVDGVFEYAGDPYAFGISIEKWHFIYKDSSQENVYVYFINIGQSTGDNLIDIKSVTIFSEGRNVVVYLSNPPIREEGLLYRNDLLTYKDTGRMNRLIESINSRMLIRITAIDNQVYDFYPSERFISHAKKVAEWS